MRKDNYNDNELIYLIRKGNKRAEELLLEKYCYYIPLWLKQLCVDKNQYENFINDYTSVGLNVIYKCIDSFRDEKGVFYTFAKTAVLNAVKNLIIKENKQYQVQQYIANKNYDNDLFCYDFPWEEKSYYEDEYYLKEKTMEINNFDGLTDNEKKVINLYLSGNSLSKIADKLNINIKSVYNYYYRAKTKLKNQGDK